MAEIRLEGVTKRFGRTTAVEDLSLTIADGEFLVLLGPTGAGKTTALRLVAGLERPDAGRIAIGGRDVTAEPPAARDVTFVFQQYSLYPHLSVYDNLAFPLRSPTRRVPEAEIETTVRELARLLQIEDKLKNRATQLSGGQMQRVAIGRALVRRPSVYLMDEPLSSLDAKLRADLRLELKRIQVDLGATILYVTHDQIEAMTLATRIGVIDRGRLVQVGSPREIYEQPVDTYVAQRLGQPAINLLPADLLPANRLAAGTRTVGARTEHIRVTPADGQARGRVKWVEHLGDQSHLHIALDGHSLVALVDPDTALERDAAVDITLADPLCFDAAGRRIG
ncbi:ABC transporter ATP-binding protein [Prosthecomicrobium hirschii]|uniref:ABC transporter ATP-binding protein n=1 Tax=Prosthecodimorpha hirschii TaxID=665126 RepID=UPI001126D8DC|nr:ABC transporter ATP-binding protein [Prosthecomicrobium hirschii]MCW1841871.1 ABC transporter ATP-binding protein [Prosthecomicrobium hirschii]TPQ49137.1 ABC transporter ATP-binding protein [Prosthecomicrobium hirschii]